MLYRLNAVYVSIVWTTEYYSDVAMMLSNCEDVYSADVPSALQTLAKIISNSDKKEELIAKTPEVCPAIASNLSITGTSIDTLVLYDNYLPAIDKVIK